MASGATARRCRLVLFRAGAQLEAVLGDLAGFHVLANCRDVGALRRLWQGCRPDLVAAPGDQMTRLAGCGFEPATMVALTGDLRRDVRLVCRARRVGGQARRGRDALAAGVDSITEDHARDGAVDRRTPTDDHAGDDTVDGRTPNEAADKHLLLDSAPHNGPRDGLSRGRRYRLRRRPSPAGAPTERAAGPGPEVLRAAADERARFRDLLFSELVDPSQAAEAQTGTPAAPSKALRRQTDEPLICCIASPKGGVGKTFVAVNLALTLSDRVPTLLLDLDLRAGDASLYLSLGRGASLADLLTAGNLDEAEEIKRHVRRHRRSRLEVLTGSGRPEASELLAPGVAGRLLISAARGYGAVVVDTPPAPVEDLLCEAALGATHILLVTGPCPASLRQCSIALEQLRRGGDGPPVLLAANRWRAEHDPDPAGLKTVLGQALAVVVPLDDEAQGAAVLAGEALVRARPRSPAALAVQRLADLLTDRPRHGSESAGDATESGRRTVGTGDRPSPAGVGGLAETLRRWAGNIMSQMTDSGTRRFE